MRFSLRLLRRRMGSVLLSGERRSLGGRVRLCGRRGSELRGRGDWKVGGVDWSVGVEVVVRVKGEKGIENWEASQRCCMNKL